MWMLIFLAIGMLQALEMRRKDMSTGELLIALQKSKDVTFLLL